MLRFFRHIRQKLMKAKRIRTYLLYAAGEILLVVIGILIALQVNNWNEERKLAKEEQVILKALHDEILANRQVLKEAHSRAKRIEAAVLSMLEYTGPDRPELTKARSDSLFNYLDAVITAEVNQSILKDLLTTGRIHLIQNDSLKHQLTSWIPLFEDEILEEQNNILFSTQNLIIPFTIQNYSLATVNIKDYRGYESRFKTDHRDIYQLPEFENLLLLKEIQYYSLMRSYERMMAYSDQLLVLIEREMEKS